MTSDQWNCDAIWDRVGREAHMRAESQVTLGERRARREKMKEDVVAGGPSGLS